ncbi:MAG: hypothetical protein ACYTEW_24835 [Planctomycetota bacterium]|jgi:hypothetical protein
MKRREFLKGLALGAYGLAAGVLIAPARLGEDSIGQIDSPDFFQPRTPVLKVNTTNKQVGIGTPTFPSQLFVFETGPVGYGESHINEPDFLRFKAR